MGSLGQARVVFENKHRLLWQLDVPSEDARSLGSVSSCLRSHSGFDR